MKHFFRRVKRNNNQWFSKKIPGYFPPTLNFANIGYLKKKNPLNIYMKKSMAIFDYFLLQNPKKLTETCLISFKVCMEANEISFTAVNIMKAEAELAKSGVLLPCFGKHFRKDEMLYKIIFFLSLKNMFSMAFNSWCSFLKEIIYSAFNTSNAMVKNVSNLMRKG